MNNVQQIVLDVGDKTSGNIQIIVAAITATAVVAAAIIGLYVKKKKG